MEGGPETVSRKPMAFSIPSFNKSLYECFYANIPNYNVAIAFNLNKQTVQYDGRMKIIRKYLNEVYFRQELRKRNSVYSYMCNVIPGNGDLYMVSGNDPNIEETIKVYTEFSQLFHDKSLEKTLGRNIEELLKNENNISNSIYMEEWIAKAILSDISYYDVVNDNETILRTSWKDLLNYSEEVAIHLKKGTVCIVGNREKITRLNRDLYKIMSI